MVSQPPKKFEQLEEKTYLFIRLNTSYGHKFVLLHVFHHQLVKVPLPFRKLTPLASILFLQFLLVRWWWLFKINKLLVSKDWYYLALGEHFKNISRLRADNNQTTNIVKHYWWRCYNFLLTYSYYHTRDW